MSASWEWVELTRSFGMFFACFNSDWWIFLYSIMGSAVF